MNLVSSGCLSLICLNNIGVKMLNSSCEGYVFDKVTKVEEDNEEVEPKISVGEANHCLRSLLVNSCNIYVEGESTADHLICFLSQRR